MKTVLLFAEFGNSGGTRTYAKQLVHLFSTRGYKLHVAGTNSADEEFRHYCNQRGATYDDTLSTLTTSFLARLLRPILGRSEETRIMSSLSRQIAPDVVVSSAGTPGRLLGSRFGFCPDIYLLHTYPTSPNRKWRTRLTSLLFSIRLPRKTHYLTVSNASQHWIKTLWGMKSSRFRFDVIVSTAGASLSRHTMAKKARFTVLTVGHVENYKGPDVWFEVAQRVLREEPDCRFIWLGEGTLLEEYREKIASLGLEEEISLLGHVSNVEEFVTTADVYFQPSLVESLGLSVLDSMRVGIPSVVSSRGGLSELVADGVTGFIVDPLEPAVMAERIVTLYRAESLAQEMGDNAKERYRECFSQEIWEQNMWAVAGL